MKRVILVLLTLSLSFVLFGCSSHDTLEIQDKKQIESKSILKRINLSFYNENSNKAQPELINVLSDKSELMVLEKMLSSQGKVSKIKPSEVKKIFLLQYEYEKDMKVVNRRYLLFLSLQDGMNYLKEIKIEPGYNFDKFTEKDTPHILEQAGMDNWSTTPTTPF